MSIASTGDGSRISRFDVGYWGGIKTFDIRIPKIVLNDMPLIKAGEEPGHELQNTRIKTVR